jgi:hypothetical protein
MGNLDTSADFGPDIGWPDASDTPAPELRAAMIKMLQALDKFKEATRGSEGQENWWSRIDAVRKQALNVRDIMTDELVFPGKSQMAAYEAAIQAYLMLEENLQFSKDTLPRPDLLEQASSFIDSLKDFPSEIIKGVSGVFTSIGEAAGEGISDTLGALAKNLWPWALVLVGIVVAVEFGPQILAATKKAVK